MEARGINALALLLFGFVSGIALSLFSPAGAISGVFLYVLAFAIYSTGFLFSYRYPSEVLTIALFGFFILGMALGVFRLTLDGHAEEDLPEEVDARVSGVVVSLPEDRETYLLFKLRAESIEYDEACAVSQTLLYARADRFADVAYGDEVTVSGGLVRPEPFETDTDRVFRYDRYLAVEGVTRIISFAQVDIKGHDKGNPVLAKLFEIKRAYVETLERHLPEPEASLGAGITAGTRGGLSDEFRDDLIRTGTIHIVVLSGYNVAIIIASIVFIGRFLRQGLRLIIAGGVVMLFVLLAGAEASLVRAALMAFLTLGAVYLNREASALRALGVAAVLMLAVYPYILWSPTFILSFLATWGLIAFSPYLEEKLRWIRSQPIRVTLAATAATQFAVLPYLLYALGRVSLVALPANIAVLLTIPLAMLFSFLTGLFGIIAYPLGEVFSWAAFVFLRYETLMIDVFSRIPFASISVPPFPFALLFLMYAMMFIGWRLVAGRDHSFSVFGTVKNR